MRKHTAAANSYIAGIDGLRAIAVLSVVLYHLDRGLLPGGFTGVDVFFVISGYVISKSLAASNSIGFVAYIVGFYERRILRIVPALLFLLIITSVATSLFIPDAWLSASNKWTAISAFFGASNLYLVSGADGYFSDRIAFNPFVHTWSLAVEEQFYLFFPLIFYIWLNTRGADAPRRTIAMALLPAVALASLVLASVQTEAAQVHAFYLLPSRFWELASGALLYQLMAHRMSRLGTFTQASSLLVFGVAIVAVGFFFADEKAFPFPWAFFPVAGTLLMIVGVIGSNGDTGGMPRLLKSRAMTYLGRISYSLYLWHWAVFTLFRWTVGLTGPMPVIAALLITFGLSVLSYHWVENAFRDNSYLRRQPSWKIVVIGLGAVATTSLVTGLMFQYGDWMKLKLSVSANGYDWSPYHPINATADFPVTTSRQSPGPARTIFVIGDSHAGAYTNMVKLAAANVGANVKMLSRNGCPIAALIVAAKDTDACRDFEKSILARMKQEAHIGDIMFLASLRVHRLGDQWGLFNQAEVLSRNNSPADIEERKRALEQTSVFIEKVKAVGLHVLMDAPKPIFRAPPFRCSDWFNRSNPVCEPGFTIERDLLIKHREPTMVSLTKLRDAHRVFIWDPFPILCSGTMCSAFDGQKPLFSDADHLSGYGGRLLVPSFIQELEEIWGSDTNSRVCSSRTWNCDRRN